MFHIGNWRVIVIEGLMLNFEHNCRACHKSIVFAKKFIILVSQITNMFIVIESFDNGWDFAHDEKSLKIII